MGLVWLATGPGSSSDGSGSTDPGSTSSGSSSSSGGLPQCEHFEEPDLRVQVDAPDSDSPFGISIDEACLLEDANANTAAFTCANDAGTVDLVFEGLALDLSQLPAEVVLKVSVAGGFESTGSRVSIIDADGRLQLTLFARPYANLAQFADWFEPLSLSDAYRECAAVYRSKNEWCWPLQLRIEGPRGGVEAHDGDVLAVPGGWTVFISTLFDCYGPNSSLTDETRFAIVNDSLLAE